MSYRRSKVVREAEQLAVSCCPPPCGKRRYLTRHAAKVDASRITGTSGGRMRVYPGDGSEYPSCAGFFHLTTYTASARVSFYRDVHAFAAEHGLPEGWTVAAKRESGGRWRYSVYVPGEKPMPSVHTYASQEIALREAVADVRGESRSA